jgi:hypothetical protein
VAPLTSLATRPLVSSSCHKRLPSIRRSLAADPHSQPRIVAAARAYKHAGATRLSSQPSVGCDTVTDAYLLKTQ